MKKKHAWILLLCGVTLIIASIPIFISWISSGIIVADPRVHYLNGLGQMAGYIGKEDMKENLTYKAHLIHEDLVEIKVQFSSLEEMKEVMENLSYTRHGREIGRYYTRLNEIENRCIFKVDSSAEKNFMQALKEAKAARKAREAKEAEEILEAEERKHKKEVWRRTPKPLPVAPRNTRIPEIKGPEKGLIDESVSAPAIKTSDDSVPPHSQ